MCVCVMIKAVYEQSAIYKAAPKLQASFASFYLYVSGSLQRLEQW